MSRHRRTCPEARLSAPTRRAESGREVIDIENYAPYFLAAVGSAWSRSASTRYLGEFGIGVTEWRVLSWIATEPGVPASRICEVIALDKAAVSRAVGNLQARGMIEATPFARDPRRKSLSLTKAGAEMHDRLLAAALEREALLIEGADPKDYEAFLRVMRLMRENVERM